MSDGRRKTRPKKRNDTTCELQYKGKAVDMDDGEATEQLMEEIVGDALGLTSKEERSDD